MSYSTTLTAFYPGEFSCERTLFNVGYATDATEGSYGNLQEYVISRTRVDGREVEVKTWNIRW
ncbi:hypothetical protein BDW59DRAFT_153221 [Aspergillus cavernicola]|uniref:Lipocalin-like domain-containing protein n=1 Tax=Aspergillus cavernicola TaxID=176166 RepID=A0ABR4HLX9_9EURO